MHNGGRVCRWTGGYEGIDLGKGCFEKLSVCQQQQESDPYRSRQPKRCCCEVIVQYSICRKQLCKLISLRVPCSRSEKSSRAAAADDYLDVQAFMLGHPRPSYEQEYGIDERSLCTKRCTCASVRRMGLQIPAQGIVSEMARLPAESGGDLDERALTVSC
jgi:hypothetical protein